MQRPDHIDQDFLRLEFTVVKEFARWRVDRFIAHKIPRLSRTKVQKILKKHAFSGEGKPIKPNKVLRTGETVVIYKKPPDEPEVNRSFEVLFEDEWLLAVDKPPLLPVHPTARYLKNTLTSLLKERYGENAPTLAHRLDSETSGTLLCTKGKEADKKVKQLFAKRKVRKTYLAIIRGTPSPQKGRIDVALCPDPDSEIKVRMCCSSSGLPSLTEYEVLKTAGELSLVQLYPRTGRQHQLRVHLAHLGHPIVGDKMYGPDKSLFLDYLSQGPTTEISQRAGHFRHALHAHRLEFVHPFTNQNISVQSSVPKDMELLLCQ